MFSKVAEFSELNEVSQLADLLKLASKKKMFVFRTCAFDCWLWVKFFYLVHMGFYMKYKAIWLLYDGWLHIETLQVTTLPVVDELIHQK